MRVLVAFASAHASTQGIAEQVASTLRHQGLDATARAVGEIDDVAGYDAFVLGSAIHNQRWLPAAASFVRHQAPAFAGRPVWLFSTSSVGDQGSFFAPRVARLMRRMRAEPQGIAELRALMPVRDHRNFAGAIEPSHWSITGRVFFRLVGGRYGDHREWSDVIAWADGIARQLCSSSPAAA